MREKGIQHLNRNGKGDQLVRVHIVTPTKISKTERELIEKLSDEENFRSSVHKAEEKKTKKSRSNTKSEHTGVFDGIKSMFS
jgi:molecular chaperone DnaJ